MLQKPIRACLAPWTRPVPQRGSRHGAVRKAARRGRGRPSAAGASPAPELGRSDERPRRRSRAVAAAATRARSGPRRPAAAAARGSRRLVGRAGCAHCRGKGGIPGLVPSEVLGFTEAKPLPDRKASGAAR